MRLSLKAAIDKRSELTRALKRHNELMQVENSNLSSSHNMPDLLSKIRVGNENLESIKLLIEDANHGGKVFSKIFRLRSLTTERSNLEALLSRLGERTGLLSSAEIGTAVDELNVDIKRLQSELDTFNEKTYVEYSPKSRAA